MNFKRNFKVFKKHSVKFSIVFIAILLVVSQLISPTDLFAQKQISKILTLNSLDSTIDYVSEALASEKEEYPNTFPEADARPIRTMYVTATAYSSTVGQTDSTPCITANGYNLCEHNQENVIAANFLPFGTKVIFPELDPEKVYTVQDRMNKRYWYRVDFWKINYNDARDFGLKKLKIEIYE